jgi:molecular chaperone GrpE (heat shock protein)
MSDEFQDDFYNLLEKHGVTEITCDHQHFNQICEIRNKVAEFIEEEKYLNQHKDPINFIYLNLK